LIDEVKPEKVPCRSALAARRALACAGLLLLATAHAREGSPVLVADGIHALSLPVRVVNEERIAPARAVVVVGPRGAIVVDSGLSYQDGERVLAAAAQLTPLPVRLAILTHPSQEAIFGAQAYRERGIPVAMHRDAARLVAARCAECLERLTRALGRDAMARTRVVVPDRFLADGDTILESGRRLRVMAPPHASAPGAIALLDARTSTLIAGSLAAVDSVPDLRDADAQRWPRALEPLAKTRCVHLVPAYGRIGSCRDLDAIARYLADLEAHVGTLLARGVTLAELDARSDLPRYEKWDRYATLHRANASRTYLRLERAELEAR
jgi:glyoxylase-like metal-dependent hydrolase (beta-lactamase superfamily II)